MTVRRFALLATATTALIAISACARTDGAGAPQDSGAPEPSTPTSSAQGLVLRMTQVGGLVPAERIVGRIPEVSVYADGRVITEGPTTMQFPGNALPNLQVSTLTPTEVKALGDEAVAAGVRTGSDLGQSSVADAPNTRIDVILGGETQSVSVAALGEAMPDDPRLTPEQREARAKLAKFVQKLRDLGAREGSQPYAAEKIAALAQAYAKVDSGLPAAPPPAAWPGPALPGDFLNQNVKVGCVLADAATVTKAIDEGKANEQTPWTSGGNQYSVKFRPLLPDETGCADLRKQK